MPLLKIRIKPLIIILCLVSFFVFMADGLWAHEVILNSGRQIDGKIVDKDSQGIKLKLSSGIIVTYKADEVMTIDDKPYSAFILEITPQVQEPKPIPGEKEASLEVQTGEITFQTVKESNIPMLEELVSEGKDLNVKNKEGLTPLMYAVSLSDKEMVEALLANGAIIDIKNNTGETALDLARQTQQNEITQVLIKAGAAKDEVGQADIDDVLDEEKGIDAPEKKSAAAPKQKAAKAPQAERKEQTDIEDTTLLPKEDDIIDIFDETQINMEEMPDELKGILGALEGMSKKDLEKQLENIFKVVGPVILIISIVINLFMIVTFWRIFEKAHAPGWGILIPFYNLYLFLKISGLSGWWMLGLIILPLIPFVGMLFPLVVSLLMSLGIARGFGKGVPFALGLLFLPLIFYPILAFSKAEYGFYRT
jgi:hypothetical protein